MTRRLGVGFIGSGFMTRFHIRAWQAVRDGDVRGVWSPNAVHAGEAAALARELGVGEARAFPTLEAMVEDPAIDCIWICGPNHTRVDNMERIVATLERGKAVVWARGAAIAGRPYLARAAEEHGGPHMPWFWRGDLQGGGVLNDMMCHSLEVGRFLLTKPGAPRDTSARWRSRRRSRCSNGTSRSMRRCSPR